MFAVPRHVLVVEDDYFQAERLASSVRHRGDKVVGPFSSSDRALPHLVRADAAILDVRLGAGTCFAVADECRLRMQPFVFISAFETSDVPGRFALAPFHPKPCDIEVILDDLYDRSGPAEVIPERSVEAFLPFLMRRARRLVPDERAAERLVAGTLRAAIAAAASDRLPPDLAPWLFDLLEEEYLLRGRDRML